jgi:GMP synthase (glutamine-hydrolysing)
VSRRLRVLSVTHGPTVPGGVFDESVVAAGHVLEHWSVPDGASPGPPSSYDAILVFGGSMHPDEDEAHPWLGGEEAFLRDAVERQVPTFGICLGAQMLVRAAGGTVLRASEPEIGWLDVSLTPAGADDPVLGVLPGTVTVFHWHHYTFELPATATELARSPVCLQAFRLAGPIWGLQFHPEVTAPMLSAWIAEDPGDLPMPPDDLRAESAGRIAPSAAQGRALADAFLREAAAHRG